MRNQSEIDLSKKMKQNRIIFNKETEYYYVKCGKNNIRIDNISKETNINEKLLTEISIWLEQNIEQIKKFGVEELIDLKNEDWLKCNEEKITEKEFIKNLNLQSIVIHKKGNIDMIFDADNIFYGHCITIYTNENLIMEEASIGY